MENNWYDNQNTSQNGGYQSYYQPSNTTGPGGPKHFGFGKILLCILAVALLAGGCGVVAFYALYAHQDDQRQEAVVDDNVVVETPRPQEEATDKPKGEEALETEPAEAPEPFVPAGDASKNLVLSSSAASAASDPTVNMIQNCMATAVGITTTVPASSYYNVYGYNNSKGDSDEISYGTGSGIVLTQDGYIVTCAHVIDGGQKIYVCMQDGTEYSAQIVGKDAQSDIAILKIDAQNLPAATLGNSTNTVVGEKVYAVGNPLGKFICSVSTGIVSGLNRTLTLDGQDFTLMQTDAAVNPGNSGGGLFNSQGELIGVVNAKTQNIGVEGLGFAIPVDSVKTIIADLMDLGFVSGRPYLGVSLQDVYVRSNNSNDPFGGYFGYGYTTHTQISTIEEDSAAEKAGLKTGDIILSIDGNEVSSASGMTSMLYEYKVGDVVKIEVLRDQKTVTLEATLAERSA